MRINHTTGLIIFILMVLTRIICIWLVDITSLWAWKKPVVTSADITNEDAVTHDVVSTAQQGKHSSKIDEDGTYISKKDIMIEPCEPANLSKPFRRKHTGEYLNLMEYEHPEYIPNYRSPCWWECLDSPASYQSNSYYRERNSYKLRKSQFEHYFKTALSLYKKDQEIGRKIRLRCLPYFYLIGFSKCGTTDLFYNLMRHPMMKTFLIPSHSYYWSYWKNSPKYKYPPISDLVDLFDVAARYVYNTTTNNSVSTERYHPIALGEGMPMTIWHIGNWKRLPENRGHSEGPQYLSAHYIHHVTPKARFIISMRNPTDRQYSDNLYIRNIINNKSVSAEGFHQQVQAGIALMEKCQSKRGLQACLYNSHLQHKMSNHATRMIPSLYALHIKKWLEVFPRDQFYFVKFEDYAKDKVKELNRIAQFLGLDAFPVNISDEINKENSERNKNDIKDQVGDMLPKTRALLDSYFKPYNRMLADLLGDERFLWKEKE